MSPKLAAIKAAPFEAPTGTKAERTRSAVLAAAEVLFAEQGYAAAKLEDVADKLGLTRAALFYYFRDKQSLYDAMLAEAFGALAKRLEQVLAAEGKSITERVELAAGAWVDSLVARPTLARLILRIVADGLHTEHGVFADDDRLAMKFLALFQEGRKSGELKPLHDNPFHVASAVLGTSVFYVAALATLVPHARFEPLDPEQVAAHKREVLFEARRLLGITRKTKSKRS